MRLPKVLKTQVKSTYHRRVPTKRSKRELSLSSVKLSLSHPRGMGSQEHLSRECWAFKLSALADGFWAFASDLLVQSQKQKTDDLTMRAAALHACRKVRTCASADEPVVIRNIGLIAGFPDRAGKINGNKTYNCVKRNWDHSRGKNIRNEDAITKIVFEKPLTAVQLD